MMAMNLSFDTLFYVIAVPAAIGAVMLILLMLAVRRPGTVPDALPSAGIANK